MSAAARAAIERHNYENDPRVIAARFDDGLEPIEQRGGHLLRWERDPCECGDCPDCEKFDADWRAAVEAKPYYVGAYYSSWCVCVANADGPTTYEEPFKSYATREEAAARCAELDPRCDGTQPKVEVSNRIVDFPARYEVCDLCDGEGKHVDPSIDAGGISTDDDFWEDDYDPDYDEDEGGPVSTSRYFRGDYDVTCSQCKGKRVVLVIDTEEAIRRGLKEQLAEYDEHLRDQLDYEAISRAERAMGA